jgi:hypothetical protein
MEAQALPHVRFESQINNVKRPSQELKFYRHSREGGNPRIDFNPKVDFIGDDEQLDSRLRGNDGVKSNTK